jgi:carbamate kinase
MNNNNPKIALIAFGGNALLPKGQDGSQAEQINNSKKAARLMGKIVMKGYELIIVHGNGPQVGNLLIQMEESNGNVSPYSLEICDAMTEGSIGYMLETSIRNELRKRSIDKEITTLITPVLVDKNDPAFHNPTKPVGPFYTKSRSRELERKKKWVLVEDSGRGYRKVVPSPKPIDIVSKKTVRDLVLSGKIVITAGGGGIPVIINRKGLFQGVEAVIDKDYAASLIAQEVGVDLFIILTNVSRIYLNYGKTNEKPIKTMTIEKAKKYLSQGQFPAGSMGPKVKAAIEYIEHGGKEVLITSTNCLSRALNKKSGTRILSSPS